MTLQNASVCPGGIPEGEPGFRRCTRTVMDTTDPDIVFDADGVSNWWHLLESEKERWSRIDREALRQTYLTRIRESGRGRPYDCILGLSGGVDSCYMAYLAKEWGLRPLVVHFDNGWNDELAVRNIETVLKHVGFELNTFVMNWPEFRNLQRSYFLASVLDQDVPADHMIFGALHEIAMKHRIKHILSGNNFVTEGLLPRAWYYNKFDLRNLYNIHRRFGTLPLKHLPKLGVWHWNYYRKVRDIEDVKILELIPYRKLDAKRFLQKEMGWSDYGGKHYESVFTRFYQAYILPTRYGIDKRKAHLSNLVSNGELTRDEALIELSGPIADPDRLLRDKRYVAKKLGWSETEFEDILALPPVAHETYGTDARERRIAEALTNGLRPLGRIVRKFAAVR